jgi:gliding motility-associated-like protein
MKKNIILILLAMFLIHAGGFSQTEKLQLPGNNTVPGTANFRSSTNNAPLNGDSSINNIYKADKCGLNYVQVSKKVTSRNTTGGGTGLPCIMPIAGIPVSCRNIEKAYLWLTVAFTPPDNASPTITLSNPAAVSNSFSAINIGTSPNVNWGETSTKVFRADVTSAISGNGNYVLNTSDLTAADIDGVTLVIIYSDVNATYQGHMIIDDGSMSYCNLSALGSLNYTITGVNACGNSTNCSAFAISGDFQFASHNATLNGLTLPFADNFYNMDVTTTSSVTAGQTTSAFAVTQTSGADCFALSVVGLYYQTTSCTTCPLPLTLSLSSVNTTCGLNNGSATATASTANYGPYNYSWSPGGQTAQTATGLAPGTYTCTITDGSGCKTATQTVTISASSSITVNAVASSPTICAGQSTVLTGSGATNYTWSANAANATTSTTTVTPASGTTIYTVTGSTGTCVNTKTVSVVVNALPNASANTVGTVGCSSTAATVNANSTTPGVTYNWSGPGIVSGGSTSTATVNLQGTYTITVTDPSSGCINTATTTVTTDTTVPNASSTTTGTLNCINNSAVIAGNSTTGGVTFSWSGPSGFSSSTLSNTVTVSGDYTFTVTDPGSGCTNISITTVTTDTVVPNASASTTGVLTCTNGTATVNGNSTIAGATYNWSGPGIVSGGNTSGALVNSAGDYTVTITNPSNGCVNTAITTVTANSVLPNASAGTTGMLGCSGGTATVDASSTTPSVTYNWSGASIVSGGNTASAIVNAAGVYTVTVTDPATGCVNTATTTVTTDTTVPNAGASSAGTITCSNSTAVINGSSTTGGVNYSWSGPAGFTSTTLSNTVSVSGNYTFTVVDPSSGCTNTAVTTVTSDTAIPNASASTTGTISCGGGTATVNGSSTTTGVSYNWSGPGIVAGGSTSTATVNIAGIYTVTVTNPVNGCTNNAVTSVSTSTAVPNASASTTGTLTCVNNSAAINGNSTSGGVTYSWSGPGGFTSSAQSPTVTVDGNYTLTVTDPASGCTNVAVTTVSTNTTIPNSSASTSGTLTCVNNTATVNANSTTSGVGYNWSGTGIVSGGNTSSASVNAAGDFTVTITDPNNGCTNTAITTVTNNTIIPNASAIGTGTISCGGGTATVTANSTTAGVNYNWSGAGIVSGSNTSVAIVNAAGTYTVTVTDPNTGCVNTATVSVTGSAVVPNANASTTGTITCTNPSATISGSSSTSGATYSWSGPSGFTSSTLSNSVTVAGDYTFTVTDPGSGCTNTATTTVNSSITIPTANAGPGVTIDYGNSTTLNASGGTSYTWSPATGLSCVNCANPSANPTVTTTYCVKVSDANGCSDTACMKVTVDTPCGEIFVPNAFSPNNDNQNDLECVYGNCIKSIEFFIYDRWGEKVFESTNVKHCWDGTFRGESLNTAVFAYYLQAILIDGTVVTKKGNISLIR